MLAASRGDRDVDGVIAVSERARSNGSRYKYGLDVGWKGRERSDRTNRNLARYNIELSEYSDFGTEPRAGDERFTSFLSHGIGSVEHRDAIAHREADVRPSLAGPSSDPLDLPRLRSDLVRGRTVGALIPVSSIRPRGSRRVHRTASGPGRGDGDLRRPV